MAVDTGIVVSVTVQKGREVCGGLREVFDVEGDVLNKTGGSFFPEAAHRGKNTGADGPILCHLLGVCREADFYAERLECFGDSIYLFL